MCKSCIFWKDFSKDSHQAKITKNGRILSGIYVKQKFLWFANNLQKPHAWEKSGSQVIAKNGSGSGPMRFQYSLIVSISLRD